MQRRGKKGQQGHVPPTLKLGNRPIVLVFVNTNVGLLPIAICEEKLARVAVSMIATR